MDTIIQNSYNKILEDNEKNEFFYEDYKKSHEKLITDLKTFTKLLEPPVLVPVCNRVLMRGNLIHTNEIMVSLGCGYFTKCTSSQAQDICRRRIIRVESVLENLEKERNFVESQINFSQNVFSPGQREIIEPYDEKAEKDWRVQHVLKLKEHRKKENREMFALDHDDIMNKLELLELQEEIEGLNSNQECKLDAVEDLLTNHRKPEVEISNSEPLRSPNIKKIEKEIKPEESREFILRKKLAELRDRKKTKCVTEEDVLKRLNELEEEEEIEDELDRLYDNMDSNNEDSEEESSTADDESNSDSDEKSNINRQQISDTQYIVATTTSSKPRSVTFAENADSESETITINFTHSDNVSILKSKLENLESPSDIYELFPKNFKKQPKSILKNSHRVKEECHKNIDLKIDESMNIGKEPLGTSKIHQITVGNVIEHVPELVKVKNEKLIDPPNKPMSKFKSMRIASKYAEK